MTSERDRWSSSFDEEELWLSLDWGLEVALTDPDLAWDMIWNVVMDAADFPDVRRAAERALWALSDDRGTGLLYSHEAEEAGG